MKYGGIATAGGILIPGIGALITPAVYRLLQKVLRKSDIELKERFEITESEAREINDAVFEDITFVEAKVRAVSGSVQDPEVLKSIHQKLDRIDQTMESFKKMYESVYGMRPVVRPDDKRTEYSEADLAKRYVQFAREFSKDNPSQTELSKHLGVSQATLSRVMGKEEFWSSLHSETTNAIKKLDSDREILFEIENRANDEISRASRKRNSSKEVLVAPDTFEKNFPKDQKEDKSKKSHLKDLDQKRLSIAMDEFTKKERMLELQSELEAMSKKQLIQALLRLSPDINPANLESMENKALVDVILALSDV